MRNYRVLQNVCNFYSVWALLYKTAALLLNNPVATVANQRKKDYERTKNQSVMINKILFFSKTFSFYIVSSCKSQANQKLELNVKLKLNERKRNNANNVNNI